MSQRETEHLRVLIANERDVEPDRRGPGPTAERARQIEPGTLNKLREALAQPHPSGQVQLESDVRRLIAFATGTQGSAATLKILDQSPRRQHDLPVNRLLPWHTSH